MNPWWLAAIIPGSIVVGGFIVYAGFAFYFAKHNPWG